MLYYVVQQGSTQSLEELDNDKEEEELPDKVAEVSQESTVVLGNKTLLASDEKDTRINFINN